ncbi:hypothetical protein AB0L10_06000 [Streptomyces flaveolus]|uniref:BP74-related protein n=1 Tax=Streptomyces flaveolus TaxID=67297 RepID=UPI00341BDC3D
MTRLKSDAADPACFEFTDVPLPCAEDPLDEAGGAFLPGLHRCPRTSRLTREVLAP